MAPFFQGSYKSPKQPLPYCFHFNLNPLVYTNTNTTRNIRRTPSRATHILVRMSELLYRFCVSRTVERPDGGYTEAIEAYIYTRIDVYRYIADWCRRGIKMIEHVNVWLGSYSHTHNVVNESVYSAAFVSLLLFTLAFIFEWLISSLIIIPFMFILYHHKTW